MEQRERRFFLVVGSPGSGKSTYVANLIKKYKNGNVCVFKHASNYDDPALNFLPIKTEKNWRQGAAPNQPVKFRMVGDEDAYIHFLNWLVSGNTNKFRNGLLVVDDCTLFERDRITKQMKQLVTMRRHSGYRLDICLVYHGLTYLPIDQFTFVNTVVMFNTTDKINYKASRIPLDELIKGVEQAKKNNEQGKKNKDKKLQYKPEIIKLN